MLFGMSLLPFSTMRIALLRLCGVKIGVGCYVGFHVSFDTNYPALIVIGDRVTISHQVSIYTHTATPVDCRLSSLYNRVDGVSVRDGAWLAANCLLLPGVTVGENCLIAAGAVVTKSTEADAIYAGNPARKVKSIPQKEVAS